VRWLFHTMNVPKRIARVVHLWTFKFPLFRVLLPSVQSAVCRGPVSSVANLLFENHFLVP